MNKLMSDVLHVCIPSYYGISNLNGVEFIKMEHLTSTNNEISIMDVKLGSKTYLKIEENNKLRADLYQKVNSNSLRILHFLYEILWFHGFCEVRALSLFFQNFDGVQYYIGRHNLPR